MFPISDQKKIPGLAILTYLLIMANVYVFYLQLAAVDIESFIRTYALVPANLTLNPSTWSALVTSQFLHGGWFHILTNMWFLAVFGPNMERAWGSLKFLAYYLLAGIAAGLAQLIFTVHPDIPVLGASGAIAGILGAYFVYFPNHRITTLVPLGFIPLFIGIPAGIVLLYWFGLQLAGGFFIETQALGGVAFFAHIGGFLAGIILAVITRPKRKTISKGTPFLEEE